MIITIDGLAGSGKSTIARALAAKYGLTYLNTGPMYRAITLKVLECGIDPYEQEAACAEVARDLTLAFDPHGELLINGSPAGSMLDVRVVTECVSLISHQTRVRDEITSKLRGEAQRHPGIIVEGRSVGAFIFPKADFKFFISVSSTERAIRRAATIGAVERIPEIIAEIKLRDNFDYTRAVSPVVVAPDAITIDADGLTAAQIVEAIAASVRARAQLTNVMDLEQYRLMHGTERQQQTNRETEPPKLEDCAFPSRPLATVELTLFRDAIREQQSRIATRVQVYLTSMQGDSLGSLQANQIFARDVRDVLAQIGRRVLCPVCERPAILTCRATSEKGQFQFDHKRAPSRTTHGGGGSIPRLKLVEDRGDDSA